MQRHPEWSLILAHPGQSVESTHKITHDPKHLLQGHFLKSTGSQETNATRLRHAASWSQGGVPAPPITCSCQCPSQTRREGGLRKKKKKTSPEVLCYPGRAIPQAASLGARTKLDPERRHQSLGSTDCWLGPIRTPPLGLKDKSEVSAH